MYSVNPCSANPMLVVIAADGSGSMSETMPQSGMKKCDVLATVVNKMIRELCIAAAKEVVKPYYELAVIYYSCNKVVNALSEIPALGEKMVNSIVKIEANPLRVETRKKKMFGPTGDVFEENVPFPVWIGEPRAAGRTPMAAALQTVNDIVAAWVSAHPSAHPPVVINVTDGVATDASDDDLERLASSIKALATDDGNTLLMNLHISNSEEARPINYAAAESSLDNQQAKLLWRMSSEIPSEMVPAVNAVLGDVTVAPGARFVTFDGTDCDVSRFIEVGTRATVPLLNHPPA